MQCQTDLARLALGRCRFLSARFLAWLLLFNISSMGILVTAIASVFVLMLSTAKSFGAEKEKGCVSPLVQILGQLHGSSSATADPIKKTIANVSRLINSTLITRGAADQYLILTPIKPKEWILVNGNRAIDADGLAVAIAITTKLRRIRFIDAHTATLRIKNHELVLVLPENKVSSILKLRAVVDQWLELPPLTEGKVTPKLQDSLTPLELIHAAEFNEFIRSHPGIPSQLSGDKNELRLSRWIWRFQKKHPYDWYEIFPKEDHLLLQTLGIIGYKHKANIKQFDQLVQTLKSWPVIRPNDRQTQSPILKWAENFIGYFGLEVLVKLLSPESQNIYNSQSKAEFEKNKIKEINRFVKEKERNPSQNSKITSENNLADWFQKYRQDHPEDWYKIFPEEDQLLLQTLGIKGYKHKARILEFDKEVKLQQGWPTLKPKNIKLRTEFHTWGANFVRYYGKDTLIKLLSKDSQEILGYPSAREKEVQIGSDQ